MVKKEKKEKKVTESNDEELEVVVDDSEEKIEEEEDSEDIEEKPVRKFVKFDENHERARHISIGDVGLATSKGGVMWTGVDLEKSLDEVPVKPWEEEDKEDEFGGPNVYERTSQGDMYEDAVREGGMYGDSRNDNMYFNSEDGVSPGGSGLYDITTDKGEKKFWSETRLPGMSRLEKTGFEKIGPAPTEGKTKQRRTGQIYN